MKSRTGIQSSSEKGHTNSTTPLNYGGAMISGYSGKRVPDWYATVLQRM